MAAHLTIPLLPSCTDPVGPTTIPPSAFIASIPNSRSNPSGLPHTTSTLILAEMPSSMGHSYYSVTTAWTRHASNRHHVHNCSPPRPASICINDCSRAGQCQLVLNTLPHQHRCLLLGVVMPCPLSRFPNSPGPVSNLTALETTCPTLLAVFCNVTLAVASMADHIGNGATLSSRCDATAG